MDSKTVLSDVDLILSVIHMGHITRVSDYQDVNTATVIINRSTNAIVVAKQWLIDNPDKQDLPVRQLAEMIGVGKDSVAKARKELK